MGLKPSGFLGGNQAGLAPDPKGPGALSKIGNLLFNYPLFLVKLSLSWEGVGRGSGALFRRSGEAKKVQKKVQKKC